MTLSFEPGLPVVAFIVDGLERYREHHDGESPERIVLHPEHRRALYAELSGAPPPGCLVMSAGSMACC